MEIHIFDIDHTLIKKSTTHCLLKTCMKHGLVTLPQLLRFPWKWFLYKLAIIEPEFIEHEVRNFSGIPKSLLADLSRESFLDHGKGALFAEAVSLLEELKKKGHRIIAATSSLDLFIEPIMEFLGFDEWVATSLEFTEDGKTTGRTEGHSVFGRSKLTAVEKYFKEKGLSLEHAAFYSDSYNDLPLLAACGKPVPVNPDRRLKQEAEKRGWKCLNFRKTLGDNGSLIFQG